VSSCAGGRGAAFRSREFKELEIVVLRHEHVFFVGNLLGRGSMRVIACSWLRPAGC
jgi:hypothetical protein